MFACLHSRAHTHTLCKHQWGVEDKTERKAREDEFNDIFSATGKREKEKRKERERERERGTWKAEDKLQQRKKYIHKIVRPRLCVHECVCLCVWMKETEAVCLRVCACVCVCVCVCSVQWPISTALCNNLSKKPLYPGSLSTLVGCKKGECESAERTCVLVDALHLCMQVQHVKWLCVLVCVALCVCVCVRLGSNSLFYFGYFRIPEYINVEQISCLIFYLLTFLFHY